VATNKGADEAELSLAYLTAETAKYLGVEISSDLPSSTILRSLINQLAAESNRPAAVLIDEYDYPLKAFLKKPAEMEKIRETMRNYYTQLKTAEENISFVFITGISKFSRVGVFSALNNLKDISTLPEYGAMCGFTHEELKAVFSGHLEAAAKKLGLSARALSDRMRAYYDGFCFDGQTRVYNPFSVLQFLDEKDFQNFWFETGTSQSLAQYLGDRKLTVEQFRGLPVTQDFARNPGELDLASPESFLYQSGYLSLRPGDSPDDFTLDYPNREVLESMSRLLLSSFFSGETETKAAAKRLNRSLADGQADSVIREINKLLARIPFDDYSRANREKLESLHPGINFDEWLYRSLIYSFLIGAGLDVQAELHTHRGRSDLTVTHGGRVWVMEIKIFREGRGETAAKNAFDQILKNGYAAPYTNPVLLGIAINDPKRAITAWKSEIGKD
jgi:hypothetical protein